MISAASWAIAFLATLAGDICWARWSIHASERAPLRAAFWALALFVIGSVVVISYTTNHILLIPCCAGAFVGTYIGVGWEGFKGK